MTAYGGIDCRRVELAEADIGAAGGGHAPRVAPPVGVEHGERPKVDGPGGDGPAEERIYCYDE